MVCIEEEPSKPLVVAMVTPFVLNCVAEKSTRVPLIIQGPTPFLYDSNKKVPWVYGARVAGAAGQEEEVMIMTRSGRSYLEDKGKEKEVETLLKRKVTDDEATNFLKLMKEGEDKVIDQLRKTPAQISLLALLLSSEVHREALMNVFKEALVPKEISAGQMENVIGSIFSNQISFGVDEMGAEGQKHVKALHITCKCNGYVLSKVMVDNGSALDVCPLSTLKQMKIDMSRVRASKTVVRAFDGTKREVFGEIELPLEVGPYTFEVTFKVMDFSNAFSLLLGRPWIHAAGAVPSTLHQKLKYIIDDRIVAINGEGDHCIYQETTVPFISNGEDEPLPFHSFELISVIKDWGEPTPSRAEVMVGKVMLKSNFIPGHGLGIRNQGIPRPLQMKENVCRYGLGYSPFQEEDQYAKEEYKPIYFQRGRFAGRKKSSLNIPPLSATFPRPPHVIQSKREDALGDLASLFTSNTTIGAIIEETSPNDFVRPLIEGESVANWTSVPVFALSLSDE